MWRKQFVKKSENYIYLQWALTHLWNVIFYDTNCDINSQIEVLSFFKNKKKRITNISSIKSALKLEKKNVVVSRLT